MTTLNSAAHRVLAVLVLAVLLSMSLVTLSHAQESEVTSHTQTTTEDRAPDGTPPPGPSLASRSIPSELQSCFDFYRFGSTPVTLSGRLHEVMQGATMGLVGSVENQNDYELRDVDVILKLFRKSEVLGKNPNGPDVVDELVPIRGATLKPHEVLPISVTYTVPQTFEPGEYQIASFVTSEKRFNSLGLSFTDDIIGSVYDFEVVGEDIGAVRFVKNAVTVGGKPHFFAAYPPSVELNEHGVDVTAAILNTTVRKATSVLTWTLYTWDGLREDNVIEQKTEQIIVAPGQQIQVNFHAADATQSMYYLKGELKNANGTVSLIGVRFANANVNTPRLNSVGVTETDTTYGTAFVCAHNIGSGNAKDVDLELSVTAQRFLDSFVGPLSITKQYHGDLSGDIAALSLAVTDSFKHRPFTLTATLKQSGVIVDQITYDYPCTSNDQCDTEFLTFINTYALHVATVAVGVLLFVIFIILRKRRRTFEPQNYSENI